MSPAKKQVMDVQRPGTTPASSGTRPVIVGHKNIMPDPMVKDEKDKEEKKPQEAEAPTPSNRKVIVPVSASESQDDEPAETDQKPQVEEKEPEKEEPKAKEAAEPEPASDPGDKADAAVMDAVVGQAETRKKDTKAKEEEQKKQEAIEKLVEEKKYFVPINNTGNKINKAGLVVLVFIVAGIIGVYGAAYAGWIDAGGMLPFISSETEDSSQEVATNDMATTGNRNDIAQDLPAKAGLVDNPDDPVSSPVINTPEDRERMEDIKILHANIESYFQNSKNYPTLAQINDQSFRNLNFDDPAQESFKDPEGTETQLVAEPAPKVYAYQATDANGAPCNNQSSMCTKYTLIATLSSGENIKVVNI